MQKYSQCYAWYTSSVTNDRSIPGLLLITCWSRVGSVLGPGLASKKGYELECWPVVWNLRFRMRSRMIQATGCHNMSHLSNTSSLQLDSPNVFYGKHVWSSQVSCGSRGAALWTGGSNLPVQINLHHSPLITSPLVSKAQSSREVNCCDRTSADGFSCWCCWSFKEIIIVQLPHQPNKLGIPKLLNSS